jgi:F-type H+-transporting ATPase subunit a
MSKRDPRRMASVCALALVFVFAAGGALAQHGDHGDQQAGHDDHAQPAQQHDEHQPEGAHDMLEGEEHGAGHGDDHGGGYHLDNILQLLIANVFGKDLEAQYHEWIYPLYALLVALIIAAFFIAIGRGLRDRSPTRRQIFAEMVVGSLYDLFRSILGDQARRFAPFLGTLFIFILCNNLFGIIPLGFAATSSFVNITLALGLMTFCYTQYVGIKELGIVGYLYHFAGQPKSAIEWVFSVIIFPIEVLSELIKPISLSLRLFGNIFGEETLIAVMVFLGVSLMQFLLGLVGTPGFITSWFPGFPFHVPFYAIALIGSTVQALVFTLLSTIYIALMLPHGHEGEAH